MKCNYYGPEYVDSDPEISGAALEEESLREVELPEETLPDLILEIEKESRHPWDQSELLKEWEREYHGDKSLDSPEPYDQDQLSETVDELYDQLSEAREMIPEEGIDLVVLKSS